MILERDDDSDTKDLALCTSAQSIRRSIVDDNCDFKIDFDIVIEIFDNLADSFPISVR